MGKGKRARRGLGQDERTKLKGLGSGFGNYSACYWYVCRFLQMSLTTPPPLEQRHQWLLLLSVMIIYSRVDE